MDEKVLLSRIRNYHEQTKHHLDAYAKGPDFLDWDQQPDPFRRFDGAPLIELPFLTSKQISSEFKSNLTTVAALFELSLGLSAWKEYGTDRWALRCNPSSGNLHPTEGYVIAASIDGLNDGIYHYTPREHALEMRASLSAADNKPLLIMGLSSIIWREAWKYGECAYRYVQLDLGHAIGAFRFAAQALGLHMSMLLKPDAKIAQLLGLERESDFSEAEKEHPDVLIQILFEAEHASLNLPNAVDWSGSANALGGMPRYDWEIINEIVSATVCDNIENPVTATITYPPLSTFNTDQQLLSLIKQRRSAQAFKDTGSELEHKRFYRMLDRLLARKTEPPWDSWPFPVYLHPVLFVHRVKGIPAGIFVLPRRNEIIQPLKTAMRPEFIWKKPATCPSHIPLYQLHQGDVRNIARTLCCHQEIASSSLFSLGMLAEFDSGLLHGKHVYRHLYWEAGLLGQVLYLEAEAAGMRGTGIGCFFDDSVHQLLGINSTEFQCLYHFTVGEPVLDKRLKTLPAYSHIAKERLTNE